MLDVDYRPLKVILSHKESKDRDAINSEECMTKFNEALNNFKEKANSFSEEEMAMLIMSLDNWSKRRDYIKCKKYDFKVGDIFYADLGNTYKPEYAYPHPVVILSIIGFYLLVIPSSTSDNNVNQAYHPIDNLNGKKYMRRVYGNETDKSDGFERTGALLLSNVKTISQGRLIKPVGKIQSELLDEIKQSVFESMFPRQHIKILKLESQIKKLELEIDECKKMLDNN